MIFEKRDRQKTCVVRADVCGVLTLSSPRVNSGVPHGAAFSGLTPVCVNSGVGMHLPTASALGAILVF